MKKLKINWKLLLIGLISTALGGLMIAYSNNIHMKYIIQIAIAALIIIVNGISLYNYYKEGNEFEIKNKKFISIVLNIILGICLLFSFETTYKVIIAIMLIIIPLVNVFLNKQSSSVSASLLLIEILFGILLICVGFSPVLSVIIFIFGFILLFIGLFNIAISFSVIKYLK